MSKLKEFFIEAKAEQYVPQVGSESLEADLLEANDALRAHDESADLTARLDDIATGLEAAIDYLEDKDALSAVEASLIADPLLTQLGVESELAASLEASSDSQQVLSVTTENLVDTLKKTAKAVIDAVVRAIRFIREFFAKIFGGFKKIESHARKLKSDLRNVDFNKSVESIRVSNPRLLAYMGNLTAQAVVTGSANLVQVNKDLNGPYLKALEKYYDTLTAVASVTAKGARAKELEKALTELHQQELIEANSRIFSTAVLGDKQFYPDREAHVKHVESSKSNKRLVTFSGFTMPVPPKFSDLEDISLLTEERSELQPPLKRDELVKLLDNVIEICGIMRKSSGSVKAVNKARERTLSEIDSTAKIMAASRAQHLSGRSMGEEDLFVYGKLVKTAWRFQLKAVQKDMIRPISTLTAHNFRVCRRALQLTADHLRAYSDASYKIDVPDAGLTALPAPA